MFAVIARGYSCVAGVSHFGARVLRGIRVFLVYALLDARILHVCSFIFRRARLWFTSVRALDLHVWFRFYACAGS